MSRVEYKARRIVLVIYSIYSIYKEKVYIYTKILEFFFVENII